MKKLVRLIVAVMALAVAVTISSSPGTKVAAESSSPQVCGPGSTYTRIKMSPQPIATFGSLPSRGTAPFYVQPFNGTACVAGATVYVAATQQVGGDKVAPVTPSQCGGVTTLSSSPVACVTDATGRVQLTYTAPVTIPDHGSVEVTSQNSSSSHPAFATHTWYLYESVYRFDRSPLAAPGSLAGGQSVVDTVSDLGVGGTPQAGAKVFLGLTSTAVNGGQARVGSTLLHSNPQAFLTDGSGQIAITYTAPATMPGSGVDTIMATSATSATPSLFNSASYAFASSTPTVSVGDVAQTEGDADGPGEKGIPAEFDVTLSTPQATSVTVQYLTVCGIGDKGCKEDYLQTLQPTPRTVTFPAGQVSEKVAVILYSYSAPEPYNETLFVQLLNPSGAVLGRTIGNGVLYGDNEGTSAATLYLGDAGVVRGKLGTQFAEFTVTLSAPQASPTAVSYTSSPGTATPGLAYTPVAGAATIAANATSTHIEVPILPSTASSGTVTFSVGIASSSGPAIGRSTGTGTIYGSS